MGNISPKDLQPGTYTMLVRAVNGGNQQVATSAKTFVVSKGQAIQD